MEGGAVLGRGRVVPEAAEGDCSVAESLGLTVVTNRPLNGIPVPGIQTGDWGRNAEHIRFRDKKPMGPVEALLKRVLLEAISESGVEAPPEMSLQQLSLWLSSSAPAVSCSLCGMRTEQYVEDATAVLRRAPLSHEQVTHALMRIRTLVEELGGESRRLW